MKAWPEVPCRAIVDGGGEMFLQDASNCKSSYCSIKSSTLHPINDGDNAPHALCRCKGTSELLPIGQDVLFPLFRRLVVDLSYVAGH